jgi:hypothetical protein
MNIEEMKIPRLIYYSLLKMVRKHGYVTGTVIWTAIVIFIEISLVLTVSSLIK